MKTLLPWVTDSANYDQFFQEKCTAVAQKLEGLGLPSASRFASPAEAYRCRAEFRLWHDGDDLNYVMFDPKSPREPVVVEEFLPAVKPIQTLMQPLLAHLKSTPALRHKLFQVEFMYGRGSPALVTLIYHRALDDAWEAQALALGEALSINIIGRSRKQKRVLKQDWVVDEFSVNGQLYRYKQYEQAFVQPNAKVNELMLNWACDRAAEPCGNLLELYCGNGNFSLPMAARHVQVVATEMSKSGIRAARENMESNDVSNLQVVRLSAEEVSEAIAGTREFRRLHELRVPLSKLGLRSVFVDPPRAGLDPATIECVRGFERIYYISCNPETLRDNLAALSSSHRPTAFAQFDQFPYSSHLECGVVLERR